MIGLGTCINVAGIVAGGIIGLLFGKVMTERYQNTLMKAAGISVLFIGISGALKEMMTVSERRLNTSGTIRVIGSFAIGALLGEWCNVVWAFF